MVWVVLGFLVIVFLTVIAPLMRQRAVVAARSRRLSALQRERGSQVITIIHRQEQIGLFGVPLVRFIDIDDSEQVLRAIRLTPDDRPIDLVLHTPGGLVLGGKRRWLNPRVKTRLTRDQHHNESPTRGHPAGRPPSRR